MSRRRRAAAPPAPPKKRKAPPLQALPADSGPEAKPHRVLDFPVVGMGASAGGLEAFQRFFTHMPPDSGIAFVIVQHLDPHHETLMPELLGRVTKMRVEAAREGMRVEPNTISIIPPNATLTIAAGVLHLASPPPERAVRAPIDSFFRSLAEDQGEGAVCILLSGSGSDGTLGLRAVKEHGGMAMAQASVSAKHDGMPRSAIATGLVDFVLPAEELPAKLLEYVGHLKDVERNKWSEAHSKEIAQQLPRICRVLRHQTGHDFGQYKQNTLVRRIQRRMLVLQVSSAPGYLERLRADPKEVDALFKDLLIGVTHFFRDPEAFAALAQHVVPRLLDRAGPDGWLRVWTPGCATGEEAYSIAILLHEEMARRKLEPRVQIFAGDIDEEALDFARAARYPEGIASQVSPERLERYFTRQHNSYVVGKEIREMCVFSKHNLIKDPPFSRLDLIVCRNLLIYMEPALQQLAAQLFHYALRPAGFLFLGPSENLAGSPGLFLTLDKKHRIFQRGDTLVRPRLAFPPADDRGRTRAPARALALKPRRPAREPGTIQLLEKILVDHFSPAWVVVNAEGGVVYYSPRTGRYLEPAAGSPSADLYSMARKGLRQELRTALHRAVKRREAVTREDVAVESSGGVRRINLMVRPLTELGDGEHGFYMIVFQELGPPRSKRQAAADGLLPAAGSERAVQQLERELRTTREHLQATVEELETANEELTSSNEELLSTNEELQSSNEELQTGKEELQSVNEELETINADLKEKVDQLDSANSEAENLYASTQIAALFLDRELRVKKFTPAATNVFRLIESDSGRPISDIVSRFTGADLVKDAKAVLRTLQPSESEVRVGESEAAADYLMRVLPHRRGEKVIDGVTVTFLDVSHVTRASAQKQHLAALMQASQDAIVGRRVDGTITTWNASATRMFGYTEQEAIGRPVSLVVPPERRQELEEVHARARRGEAIQPFETERLAKDGSRMPVSVAFSSVRDAEGKVVELSGSFRDLSELARAKAALQQELRRKDEFLAMLSHELRNPLAPLRACLDVLQSQEANQQQKTRAREMMTRQIGQLTTLVNDLLDASRVASGKIKLARQTLDLVEIVREVIDDIRPQLEQQGLAAKLRLPSRAVWVEGDPTRLAQAVGNVLNNAVKFTETGSIEVGLSTDADRGAVLKVRDSGVGMDAATLDSLFEPFSQADRSLDRSRGGLGLGLALCKGLIEAHGGSIRADSDGPGKGSEFTIRLPLSKQPPKEVRAPEAARAARGDGQRRRVLIVEDNSDAAESLALLLEIVGHTVKTVEDGSAALEQARTFQPDVVFCDVGLPGGMDGYEVAKAFRADPALREVRLVALTGYGREEDIARSAEAGFEIHARKPIDADTLRRMLTELPNRS